MLTATLNFYVNLRFIHQKRKRIKNSRKKVMFRSTENKSEIAMLPRHAAPVAQWTSVLDF